MKCEKIWHCDSKKWLNPHSTGRLNLWDEFEIWMENEDL